jgi:homoserine O-succinyltransferase/O-acetyltransferase
LPCSRAERRDEMNATSIIQPSRVLSERGSSNHDAIVIGLVNNMPDAALQTTERQFHELLSAASQDHSVYLKLFTLPQLAREGAARAHVYEHYDDISELWATRLDGLIVTGTEPRTSELEHEPYWPTLRKLVDWAEGRTISAVWSCLAAHAAVLHIDGICRQPLREKLSGVFECVKAADHAILAGAPSRWCVPHSRQNGLSEDALVSKNYRILSKSSEVGADMFVKETKSLFVFLQGHPEYGRTALLREYRRDIRRFIAGERDKYPEMPRRYFDEETARAFARFRERTLQNRDTVQLLNLPDAEAKLPFVWREPAVRLYTNWLSYLAERRCRKYTEKKSDFANALRPERNDR